MTSIRIILSIFLVTIVCHSVNEAASCCNSGTANRDRSEDVSAEDQRETWLRGVQALDRLHRFWFQRRLLEALHIDGVPEEATLWRRRRDQQRRSISSAEASVDGEEEAQSFRRYTLRIIGVPESSRSQRAHRRRHNHQRHRGENFECASEMGMHYSFYSKLPSSSSPQQYETQLEKAELELWHTNESLPHLHVRNGPTGDENEDRMGPSSTASSWSVASRRDGGWSPFRLVQGRDEHTNGSLFVSDITDALRSFWSTTAGANITISLVNRNDQGGAPCIRSVSPQSHRQNHRRRPIPEIEDDESTRPPLVLKLSLIEKPIHRGPRKRSLNGLSLRPNATSGGRKPIRQLIIQDCENQWDATFLRETSIGQYDDLMPCCRRRVHIDFQDLGWGSWVVSPLSFDSYYCMGRCTNFGGFATADTDGAAFYTEAMNLYRDARNSGLTPCCSPVKFSPLTITVLTGDNEEMTQTLEDVVVKQCGCM